MDRDSFFFKKKEGRKEGEPQEEVPQRREGWSTPWVVRTAAPGSLHPLEASGHL